MWLGRFLAVLIVFALCIPAEAQQPKKVARIGYLGTGSRSSASKEVVEAFQQGLGDLGLIPVTEFAKRHECQGFSVLPPKGENWFIDPFPTIPGEPAPPLCEVLFVKILGRITRPEEAHTILVLAGISQISVGFQTSEEFLRFVERLIKENSLPRYRLLESNAQLDNSLGSVCVRYERTVEDTGVPQFPSSVFIETDKGFFCTHPRASKFVVTVHYSQRLLKGQRPLSLEQEIEPVFKSLTFTSVEQMNRAQPSPQGSYTPSQAEVVALAESASERFSVRRVRTKGLARGHMTYSMGSG